MKKSVCMRRCLLILILGPVASAAEAHAQSLEPRAYVNTPVGLNFLVLGYGYLGGGVGTEPSVPLEDAEIRVHTAVFAYVRSLNVAGRSGKVDVVLPYAWLSGSAELAGAPRERHVSGPADPRFRVSVNLFGAPALSLQEFAGYKQDMIVGVSLQVSAPLGRYDSDKLVNIGTHRWSFMPELGLSKAWGPLTLELAGGATFFTGNDDFLNGLTREQDPIYSVQGHITYALSRSGIWIALDGTYYTGGRTTVDGVPGDDLQENSRFGATLALPVDRGHSVKLYASTGVSTRTGTDFDAVGVAWQYRFGGEGG